MTTGALKKHESFGSGVPLGDPAWYQGLNSPYYTQSHVQWRAHVNKYVEEVLEPIAGEWDRCAVANDHAKCEVFVKETYLESGRRGILASCVGQPWPQHLTDFPSPENYDYFHELITLDETARMGGGIAWAIMIGLGIGLPPVLNFGVPGNKELQERCARECMAGRQIICLNITEPTAGSDVANIATTAQDCGDHFLVNGEKKWITNGIYADYFSVAVRTGPPGSKHKGISMLLLERSMPGIETRKLECMGVWPSGTTFVTFTDVKVPKTNIIGKLGEGFKQVMFNFNHERWQLLIQNARMARTCVEEALSFARQRKTFGKFLIEHQVIQHKIAEMGRLCEAQHAWIESITYQMNTMSREEQNAKLGGIVALCKVQVSKGAEFCAREAMQVFGGAGYTRTGKGEKVERIYREVKAYAIPGGSEEIMLNLAVGQLKFVQRTAPDPKDEIIKALQDEIQGLKQKAKL